MACAGRGAVGAVEIVGAAPPVQEAAHAIEADGRPSPIGIDAEFEPMMADVRRHPSKSADYGQT